MQTEKNRPAFGMLDMARLFMAVCVVAIHTQPLTGVASPLLINGFEWLVRLAVPFFFLCAGFFLLRKLDAAESRDEKLRCIRGYIGKMARSYLIWTAVYLPVSVYGMVRAGSSLVAAAAKYVFQFLFVGEQFYSWPLWYLLACVYAGVFLYVACRIGVGRRGVLILSLTVYVLSFAATWLGLALTGSLATPETPMGPVRTILWQLTNADFELGRVLTGVGFLPLGMLFTGGRRLMPRWMAAMLLAASAVVGVMWRGFTDTPLLMIPALALFDLLLGMQVAPRPAHRKMREASGFVYYIHMQVMFLYNLTLGSFEGEAQYGWRPLLFTLAGCWALWCAWQWLRRRFTKNA